MGTWRITLAEALCRTKHIIYQKLVPACQPYQSINRVAHPTRAACSESATLIVSAVPLLVLTLHEAASQFTHRPVNPIQAPIVYCQPPTELGSAEMLNPTSDSAALANYSYISQRRWPSS